VRRLRASQIVIATGAGILVLGAAIELAPMRDAAQWQASPEAARAERNAAAPTPVWITPTTVPVATLAPAAPEAIRVPAPTRVPVLGKPIALDAAIVPPPTPPPSTSDLRLTSSAFAFEDPPQPGAHAHLAITIHNPTSADSEPVTLAIPTSWLAGYQLQTVSPGPLDGQQADGALRLTFNGPSAAQDVTITLKFVATDEVIDSPTVTVLDADGRSVGRAHPPTEAPRASPGPIYSLDIPRLKLHTGVVPVDWEPPLFVVGQVRTSAWVTRGNSVLVGHVRGATGYNVFIHLDQLEVGDEIVANSRGQAYNFVVSQTEVLPEDDTSPADPTRAPRLTLMTCAGDWNPITQDYSDRLWVIAEPA
jgi:LPXTG-site transpeptidase (sortase) family protein